MSQNAWASARNLLCVRLDSLGDVLMTTPALRALKAPGGGRRLTLLTSPAGAEVAKLVPEVDEVLVYDAPWMKATAPRTDSDPDRRMVARLRQGRFDAAVVFTVYSQNPLPAAMLCYLAGVPLRLAYCRENPYQLLTDWVRETEPEQGIRHEVRRQLDLTAVIGAWTGDERLSLRVPQAARALIPPLLETIGLDLAGPWLVVHPGASAASRRYPPEGFARAARLLALEHGYQVVFTGGPTERELVETVQAAMGAPSHALVGCLSLAELAALIEAAPLLIANNSGPAHVAAAVGTPVVDLYALTNPQHIPWAVPNRVLSHDVPCKYCYRSVCPEGHHRCLRLVRPRQVVDAALELLGEARGRPPALLAGGRGEGRQRATAGRDPDGPFVLSASGSGNGPGSGRDRAVPLRVLPAPGSTRPT
jgi:lipopolysaccharide heptosyltransferase II